MISVDSNISRPGPKATHRGMCPLHVDVSISQGNPESRHLGPAVFGDTSPRLVLANAATKDP